MSHPLPSVDTAAGDHYRIIMMMIGIHWPVDVTSCTEAAGYGQLSNPFSLLIIPYENNTATYRSSVPSMVSIYRLPTLYHSLQPWVKLSGIPRDLRWPTSDLRSPTSIPRSTTLFGRFYYIGRYSCCFFVVS